MSTMEGFFVLDSDNSTVGDKHKVEKTSKGSLGSVARKRLADISNLPQQPKPSTHDEKSQIIPTTTKEYIDQLQKENMALMKLLVDRNKIIELSGVELQKLRINLQKVQQQNLQLAQANSQMLAELNAGKDRLKSLHHELGCKNGVLIAKRLELQEKAKPTTCQQNDIKVGATKCEESSSQADRDDNKPCNTNRKQKSKSLGPSTVKQVKAEVKAENKRLCLRRQSARFTSVKPEPTEDLFEIDNAKFPACSVSDEHQQEDYSASMCSPVKKEVEERNTFSREEEAQAFLRSSIGRPSRAAKKVQSYKEIPLNVKMRRTG